MGPAGWSYDDWEGIVYPRGVGSQRLDHIVRLFDLVEINSTFYGSPAPRTTAGWAERLAERPGFRFTAKLVRAFTHDDPTTWSVKTRDDFRDGMEPLREAGVLACLLVQFPWFYAANEPNLHRMRRIRRAFPEHELVVELRHRSWLESRWLDEISSLGYSFCCVDQPPSKSSLGVTDVVTTGPIGYLRLHGRNAEKWFDRKAKAHEKYDYLYSDDEVRGLVKIAEQIRERSEKLFVVANNHYVGKGPANALQIAHALTGHVAALPESLCAAFPALRKLVSGSIL